MVMIIQTNGGRGPKLVYSAHQPKLFQTEATRHLRIFRAFTNSFPAGTQQSTDFLCLGNYTNLPFEYAVSIQCTFFSSKVQRYLECTTILLSTERYSLPHPTQWYPIPSHPSTYSTTVLRPSQTAFLYVKTRHKCACAEIALFCKLSPSTLIRPVMWPVAHTYINWVGGNPCSV